MERHQDQLRANSTPTLVIHGRKDPIIHFEEVERLFQITKNCMLEVHDFGHNFGPPREQEKILGKAVSFMKRFARTGGAEKSLEGLKIGSDTDNANVTVDVEALAQEGNIPKLYDVFCTVQTAADTHDVFTLLLEILDLARLEGRGLQLFLALKDALQNAGLNHKQAKLSRDLHSLLMKAQGVVGDVRFGGKKKAIAVLEDSISLYGETARFNKVLVCGAEPVGLRTACELQLLGFDVQVVEKRANFSRANILTFWDETMADMLGLGVKSYFPNLQPASINKHPGTRQIQVCLLKTLLLLGGRAQYGMEVVGLRRPEKTRSKRWRACFRPYVKHRRAEMAAAQLAVEFQQAKDYEEESNVSELERNSVDENFLNFLKAASPPTQSSLTHTSSQREDGAIPRRSLASANPCRSSSPFSDSSSTPCTTHTT